MEVIPVINCADRACAEEKLASLAVFLPHGHFIHLDIADGSFTFNKTWNDPRAWREFNIPFKIEAHLMVEHPLIWIEPWLKKLSGKRLPEESPQASGSFSALNPDFPLVRPRHPSGKHPASRPKIPPESRWPTFQAASQTGVARFIVQVETVNPASFKKITELAEKNGVEVMLALNPETAVSALEPYMEQCPLFQILCVTPGLAGQPFLPLTLEKVEWLRANVPHATIEVDGGMNPETARLAKEAGADIIVSASDIFGSQDPGGEYRKLEKI